MSDTSTLANSFQVTNVKLIGKGNVLARFDLVVDGLLVLWGCGFYRTNAGEKYVKTPAFNRGRYDDSVKEDKSRAYIDSGAFDRTINPIVTAQVEAEVAKIQANISR